VSVCACATVRARAENRRRSSGKCHVEGIEPTKDRTHLDIVTLSKYGAVRKRDVLGGYK
jgi:hypothetical protein